MQRGAWPPQLRKLRSRADLIFEPCRRISESATRGRTRWGWEQGPHEVSEEPEAVKEVFGTSASSLVVFVQKNRGEVWKAS